MTDPIQEQKLNDMLIKTLRVHQKLKSEGKDELATRVLRLGSEMYYLVTEMNKIKEQPIYKIKLNHAKTY